MNKPNKNSESPAVGVNLHRERRRRQLSLDKLALSSGVSKAMLSQIESDKVNPTIATLWKIANALDIEIEALIRGPQKSRRRFEVTRSNQITSIASADPGAVFEVLSPVSMAEHLELYRMKLEPGCCHHSQEHRAGTMEFLTILSGTVEVSAGDQTAELHAGDFILYESDVAHSIINHTDQPAELHMVVQFSE